MNAEWIVTAADAGTRLDKYLAAPERLGSRGKAASALERGKVLLNGAEAGLAEAAHRLAGGDAVRLWSDRPGSSKRRLEPLVLRLADGARSTASGGADTTTLHIIHEDDGVIVVNKPPGLLTVPLERKGDPSVLDLLEAHLRSHGKRRQPLVVHRIDRDTSGLVLFAKQPRAQEALREQFVRHDPERIYAALVYGHLDPPEGTWRDLLSWDQKTLVQRKARPDDPRAKEAICQFQVVEEFQETSLIDVKLHTGKRNQIRIQASLRGHRLVGEKLYARGADPRGELPFPRQALHARLLAFQHPLTDRPMTFEAPLPDDMLGLIGRLRGRSRSDGA